MRRIGGIEAGGTKFVCGVGNERGEIEEKISFPTQDPETTLDRAIGYFRDKRVEAVGIGSFGPVDLDPSSPYYGYITTTPKPGWSQIDFLGTMKRALNVPCGWDTDVNAAAWGELRWGAARGLDSCVYYTIGTGVGMGAVVGGRRVHGLVHPESGHIPVRRHAEDAFAGVCPYHGDCLEGMASGPAVAKRWNRAGADLPADHPAWALEAYYIGQAVIATILMLSPHKIILGGGVMKQRQLFPAIREEVRKGLNGYVNSVRVAEEIDDYIVPPGLGDNAGLCGALALALEALEGAG
jgi:fructokinase